MPDMEKVYKISYAYDFKDKKTRAAPGVIFD